VFGILQWRIFVGTVPLSWPSSASQYQLWLADELRLNNRGYRDGAYTTAEALAIHGPLNVEALIIALQKLQQRHETMRTIFSMSDGTLQQIVHPASPPRCEVYALESVRGHEAEFGRLVDAVLRQPFSLNKLPVWRAVIATAGSISYVALVMHHIVADGWSARVLLQDLQDLYRAQIDASPVPDSLPWSYRHYGGAVKERMTPEAMSIAIRYWRDALHGAPEKSTLPGLGPDSMAEDVSGSAHLFLPDQARRHNRICEKAALLATTPYILYLAAYGVALARMTVQRDLVVGMPSANRDQEGSEAVVGPFATVLPVRLRFPSHATPVQLVQQVKDAVLGAFEHQFVPLTEIVAAAGQRSSRSGMPLFQTVAAQRMAEPITSFAGFRAHHIWTAAKATKYDLGITFPSGEKESNIVLEYDIARYDGRIMSSLEEELGLSIEELLQDEVVAILDRFPEDTCEGLVHERVAAVARAVPRHPAIIVGRDWCSYADLERQATRAAAGLRALGIGPGDFVGLRVSRGINFVVCALAVLKRGAAYIPTDPSWPLPRVQQVLAMAALTICDEGTVGACDHGNTTPAELMDRGTITCEPITGNMRMPFCAYYTSGSTGTPKGVLLEHRSVRNLTAPSQPFAVNRADRMAHVTNLAFDAGTLEIWGTLSAGATIMVNPVMTQGPADYAAIFAHSTAAAIATGLFEELVEHPDCRSSIRSLRLLSVGGNAVSTRAPALIEQYDRIQLNVYGPTEFTTLAIVGPIGARTPWNTVPIGKPIVGARAYVLDEHLAPVPVGEVGMLYLSGAGLAVGYLDDPRLTATRFLPDPWGAGERMYETGDQVRLLTGGSLDFVGRADMQLKIRSFRVEPREIETALQAQPGVCMAYAGVNEAGQLVAVIQPDPDADVADLTDRLQARLRSDLPSFMVPEHIEAVLRAPITPNGKTDRAALLAKVGRANHAASPSGQSSSIDDTLRRVLDLWESVFESPVSDKSDFFEIGGDSLKAIRLLAKCRNEFNIDLKPVMLFDYSNPRDFAALLTELLEERSE
jgi:amino acid adenylation domain-containing protein